MDRIHQPIELLVWFNMWNERLRHHTERTPEQACGMGYEVHLKDLKHAPHGFPA
tara:strand:+ start:2603 stop:2764 length:162 start_codon:yes stop_codon:yes gene_type:complete